MRERSLWSKDYVFLLIAVFFASFPHQAYTYIVPIYVLDIGGDNSASGMMIMGLTVAGIITRLIVGPLIDKLGRKKMLVAGSLSFAVNTVLYCFADSVPELFVLRIINGITQGIYFPVPPTLAADISPKEKVVDAMGFFGIAGCASAALAPVLGTFLYENLGANGLFIISTVIAFISFIFTVLIKDSYVPVKKERLPAEERKKFSLPKISGIIELSILAPSMVYFFINFGYSSVANFLGPYGVQQAIQNISVFFLVSNIAMVVIKLITGKLMRKFGLHKLIFISLFMLAASIVLVSAANNIAIIYAAAVFYGIGLSVSTQLLQVMILEIVPINRRGVATSTYMLLSDIGLGVGASVWGAASIYMGYFWMFVIAAATVLISVAIHLEYIRKHRDTVGQM